MAMQFKKFKQDFLKYHQNSLNTFLHLITTPLGFLGLFILLNYFSSLLSLGFIMVYAASLLFFLPKGLNLINTLVLLGLYYFSLKINAPFYYAIVLLIASYLLQELAHIITNEATLQSNYDENNGKIASFLWHTYFLLPLVLIAPFNTKTPIPSWLAAKSSLFFLSYKNPEIKKHIETVHEWVKSMAPTKQHTTHWWYEKLDKEVKDAFFNIANAEEVKDCIRERFGTAYNMQIVDAMNEIYVAGPSKKATSDTVFYADHVDGPWGFFPFCTLYRAIVAISENKEVETFFPMKGTMKNKIPSASYTVDKGNIVGFDYHREPHFIKNKEHVKNKEQRVVLKVHYVVYPKVLYVLGMLLKYLSILYNTNARKLFLYTLKPQNILEKIMTKLILVTTSIFNFIFKKIGLNNLFYVLLLALISVLVSNYYVFLYGTSFIHYLMYIAQYNYRKNVSFGEFKRNVFFFKVISLVQLFGIYFYLQDFQILPISLIVIGYTLAASATHTIGIDRTYFGAELGVCEPQIINKFPYSIVPHPMILGAIIALTGFLLTTSVQNFAPLLVPIHIGLYILHLIQEITFSRITSKAVDI